MFGVGETRCRYAHNHIVDNCEYHLRRILGRARPVVSMTDECPPQRSRIDISQLDGEWAGDNIRDFHRQGSRRISTRANLVSDTLIGALRCGRIRISRHILNYAIVGAPRPDTAILREPRPVGDLEVVRLPNRIATLARLDILEVRERKFRIGWLGRSSTVPLFRPVLTRTQRIDFIFVEQKRSKPVIQGSIMLYTRRWRHSRWRRRYIRRRRRDRAR